MTKKRLIFSLLALGLLTLVLYFRWGSLDHYTPEQKIEFKAEFRTMGEHNELMRDREWPYILRIDEDSSALLYYGSRHTSDAEDPQIQEICDLWDEFTPTAAVTENRLGFYVGSFAMGVSAFGEFACAYYLAETSGIPVYSLEPSWEVEVQEMCSRFDPRQVTLFYTLRVFLSERGDLEGEECEELAAHLLAKRGSRPGLEGSLPDLAALDAVWDESFAEIGAWRELPGSAADPSDQPTRLGELANFANELRDRHAARVIIDLLENGERVFAIAGGSHVVKQEPVIRAALAGG